MKIEEIIILSSVDSTNSFLKRDNPQKNVCVRALTQTGGRGRLGRSFLSPEGGLYFSVIFPCKNKHLATIAAAVVVSRCLQNSIIKWPNDILINGKKACGILCECNDYDDRIIVGIGVNVDKAPLETSCAVGGDSGSLFKMIVEEFQNVFTLLDYDPNIILSQYRKKLFLSYTVCVCDYDRIIIGQVAGIDNAGRLLVCDRNGIIHTVSCGEAVILSGNDSFGGQLENKINEFQEGNIRAEKGWNGM